ncbi:MAG: response regulator [Nannocystaceae bacterium]|nr:response regulator [Nannocystaceae bacterium]
MAKILIVDDSATIRLQLRGCLQPAGHELVEAENGAIGLQKARFADFDFIIMDVNMPVMNGLEMLENLRLLDGHRTTPVFVLTTESSKEMVARGKRSGATAWIVKPFKSEVLLKGIDFVLARQAA